MRILLASLNSIENDRKTCSAQRWSSRPTGLGAHQLRKLHVLRSKALENVLNSRISELSTFRHICCARAPWLEFLPTDVRPSASTAWIAGIAMVQFRNRSNLGNLQLSCRFLRDGAIHVYISIHWIVQSKRQMRKFLQVFHGWELLRFVN